MKRTGRNAWRRAATALMLLAVASGTAGCTYLRLNSFRRQLADFNRYVLIATAPVPTVSFREPVLEPKDVDWLLGLVPRKDADAADTIHARYEFQKLYPAGGSSEPEGAFDLPVETTFVSGKLAEVCFSERIAELLNTASLTELFRQASSASLPATGDQVSWPVGQGLQLPAVDRVLALCGSPFEESETEQHRVFRYCYRLPTQTGEPAVPCGEATLKFRKDTGQLEKGAFRVGHLDIALQVRAGGKGSITLKRRA